MKGFVLLSSLSFASGLLADGGMLKSTKTISADIVELIAGREIPEHQMHIWIDREGLAMEVNGVPGKSPHLIHLFNYKKNKSWVVSPEGKRFCELPKREEDNKIVGGILSTSPCLGFESIKLRETMWNELLVTVWQCLKEQQVVATHYYSESYGIVVKEEGNDGLVRVLRDIQVADKVNVITHAEGVDSGFMPSENYRSVTVDEFFFAKRPLEQYLEKE